MTRGFGTSNKVTAMVASAAVAALLFAGASADASSGPAGPRFSLTISPARLVVPPRSGRLNEWVTATNTGRTPLDVHVELRGFRQLPSGTVLFGSDGVTGSSTWVSAKPNVFSLRPGAHRRVRVKVRVPAGAEPGDHQVGLLFLVPALQARANLLINRAIGVQMLVQAPGPVIRHLALTDFAAPMFSTGGAIPLTLGIRNSGTVHRDFLPPSDRIVAHAGQQRVGFPGVTVLAGSSRILSTTWSDPPWLCRCQLVVAIPDGHGGISVLHTTVWVFPFYQALGLVLLLLGLFLLARWRRRRTKAALAAAHQAGVASAQRQPA
jgi:hypothetical protein